MSGIKDQDSSAKYSGLLLIGIIASIKLIAHLLTGNQYGYFIDELYTIACGEHVLKGLVDIPPLVPILSWLSGHTMGYSLFAIHILPAITGSATVFVAGLITRELGGGRFAQALTALCVALGPVWLAFNAMFAYDGFDQLFSILFFLLIIRLLKTGNARLWIAIGIMAGIALMTKYTMLFIGISLLISLVLTRERKYFLSPWLYLGGIVCGLIVLPWIIWEFSARWPLLEYWSNYAKFRTFHASPVEFIVMLIVSYNPLVFPLWLAGFYYFFFHKEGRTYRLLGWIGVLCVAVLIVTKAKFYMASALMPMMIAGGAILIERNLSKGFLKFARTGYVFLIVLLGIFMIPNGLPVFPPDGMARYFSRIAFLSSTVKTDNSKLDSLPQIFADRFGWPERVKAVAEVYNSLTPEEQSRCMIYTGDYGSAGAIDLLGGQYGLPKAVSSHLSYFLWGYGKNSGEIAITIQVPGSSLRGMFKEVNLARQLHMDYVMPWENNTPIYLCRGLRSPIDQIWIRTKHYD